MAQNYKLYREKLKSVATPLIPYLGIWLTDLTVNKENVSI